MPTLASPRAADELVDESADVPDEILDDPPMEDPSKHFADEATGVPGDRTKGPDKPPAEDPDDKPADEPPPVPTR
jgi:hypothetical protein